MATRNCRAVRRAVRAAAVAVFLTLGLSLSQLSAAQEEGGFPLAHAAIAGDTTLVPTSTARSATRATTQAQELSSARGPRRKQATASPLGDDEIRLDGVLNDAAWSRATFVSDFLQKEPDQGAQPSERTEVAFVFDGGNLYVGARMYADDPAEIASLMTRRDEPGTSERLIISLDTFHDRRTSYSFAVTAAGVRLDWYNPQDNEFRRDGTFDPVWVARTRIDSLGWTAEMRIPFSQLRFNEGQQQTWGLNINRFIPSRNEDIYWVYVPRDETGWASRFGQLSGVNGIKPTRRVELMPFLASDTELRSPSLVDAANPFGGSRTSSSRLGMDLKMGLGPNLTLDGTINPDFGQVNFDPAVVNLSAFETIFDEQRPFFTEGNQIFRGNGKPGPRYFFSRRIGARPHGSASGDFVDSPAASTILGAAKITGRLESGLSVGVLGALTDAEYARTFDAGSGGFGRTPVEPTTGYGVVRLQQELGPSASTVGLTLSGIRRDVGHGTELGALLPRQAFTGGGDWLLRLNGGEYEVNGHFGLSYVQGDSLAIGAIQRGSTHYFQRPDQSHVTFDPARTSLLGASGSIQFAKNGGRHWLWNGGLWADSPQWELNDVGQLFGADDIRSWFNLRYRETEPGSLLRNYSIGLDTGAGWNFGGVRKSTRIGVNGDVTWKNFMRSNVRINYSPRAMSDNLTRGGPLMGQPAFWSAQARVSNNFSSSTRWSVSAFRGTRDLGADYFLNGSLSFQPGSRWRVSVEPSYSRTTNRRQYFATLDGGPAATFGRRYVFSTIRQSQLSAGFRVGYAFTPDLNLDLTTEPFTASGRFSNLGELPTPRSFGLREYGTDGTTLVEQVDPTTEARSFQITDGADSFSLAGQDFRLVSFRSNMVLRWEWKPGSTLFLVWQQNRSSFASRGDLVTPGSLIDSFAAPGTSTLVVKFTYWLPMS